MAKPTTFMASMKDFFGLKDGQKLMEFNAEIKDLGADRSFWIDGLKANGYDIQAAPAA